MKPLLLVTLTILGNAATTTVFGEHNDPQNGNNTTDNSSCQESCLIDIMALSSNMIMVRETPVEGFKDLCRFYKSTPLCITQQERRCSTRKQLILAKLDTAELCTVREQELLRQKSCVDTVAPIVWKICDGVCSFSSTLRKSSQNINNDQIRSQFRRGSDKAEQQFELNLGDLCDSVSCFSSCFASHLNDHCPPAGSLIMDALLRPFSRMAERLKISPSVAFPNWAPQCRFLASSEQLIGQAQGIPRKMSFEDVLDVLIQAVKSTIELGYERIDLLEACESEESHPHLEKVAKASLAKTLVGGKLVLANVGGRLWRAALQQDHDGVETIDHDDLASLGEIHVHLEEIGRELDDVQETLTSLRNSFSSRCNGSNSTVSAVQQSSISVGSHHPTSAMDVVRMPEGTKPTVKKRCGKPTVDMSHETNGETPKDWEEAPETIDDAQTNVGLRADERPGSPNEAPETIDDAQTNVGLRADERPGSPNNAATSRRRNSRTGRKSNRMSRSTSSSSSESLEKPGDRRRNFVQSAGTGRANSRMLDNRRGFPTHSVSVRSIDDQNQGESGELIMEDEDSSPIAHEVATAGAEASTEIVSAVHSDTGSIGAMEGSASEDDDNCLSDNENKSGLDEKLHPVASSLSAIDEPIARQ